MSENIGFNISEVIGPLMISAILKGEDISPLIDAMINEKINETMLDKVLASVNIPEEYKDVVDVLKLAAQLDSIKAVMAAIKGESYEPKFGVDKVIEFAVTLQLLSALTSALGGGTSSGSTSGTGA